MHGVPSDLPLSPFVGDEIEQLRISQHQLQLLFCASGSIRIEGNWTLFDSNGNVVDHAQEHKDRITYKVHLLLCQTLSTELAPAV